MHTCVVKYYKIYIKKKGFYLCLVGVDILLHNILTDRKKEWCSPTMFIIFFIWWLLLLIINGSNWGRNAFSVIFHIQPRFQASISSLHFTDLLIAQYYHRKHILLVTRPIHDHWPHFHINLYFTSFLLLFTHFPVLKTRMLSLSRTGSWLSRLTVRLPLVSFCMYRTVSEILQQVSPYITS